METLVTLLCEGNVLNGVVDGKNVSSVSMYAWWGGVVSTSVIIIKQLYHPLDRLSAVSIWCKSLKISVSHLDNKQDQNKRNRA